MRCWFRSTASSDRMRSWPSSWKPSPVKNQSRWSKAADSLRWDSRSGPGQITSGFAMFLFVLGSSQLWFGHLDCNLFTLLASITVANCMLIVNLLLSSPSRPLALHRRKRLTAPPTGCAANLPWCPVAMIPGPWVWAPRWNLGWMRWIWRRGCVTCPRAARAASALGMPSSRGRCRPMSWSALGIGGGKGWVGHVQKHRRRYGDILQNGTLSGKMMLTANSWWILGFIGLPPLWDNPIRLRLWELPIPSWADVDPSWPILTPKSRCSLPGKSKCIAFFLFLACKHQGTPVTCPEFHKHKETTRD